MKVIQFFPEWGFDRGKIREISQLLRFPSHHEPYTFVVPYDTWIDALEADSIRGVPHIDGEPDYGFIDEYDAVLTLILSDNIGAAKWIRDNYPDKLILAILEPFPPWWYIYDVNGIMSKVYPSMKIDVDAADVVLMDSSVYVKPLRKIYGSDKIVYCPNPVETEYIQTFTDLHKREHRIIGGGRHSNFQDTLTETNRVLEIFGRRGIIERWLFNSSIADPNWDVVLPFRADHRQHLREQNMIGIFLDNCTGGCSIQSRRCGAMGIPIVGNTEIDSHVQINPSLARKPNDYDGMARILERLIYNDTFYARMASEALTNVTLYSYDNCRKRLMEAIDNAKRP